MFEREGFFFFFDYLWLSGLPLGGFYLVTDCYGLFFCEVFFGCCIVHFKDLLSNSFGGE